MSPARHRPKERTLSLQSVVEFNMPIIEDPVLPPHSIDVAIFSWSL